MSLTRTNSFLLVLSNLCFGVLPILVKLSNQLHYSAIEETFFRFAFGLSGVAVLALFKWQRLTWVNRTTLFWRGFFGGLSILGYFIALQTTSSGEGTLLNYTYILWANIFAVFFFQQKAPRGFFPCLLLAALGVQLVLNVSWDHVGLGHLAGLFSGFTGGAAILAVKRARATDSALSVFASFAVFSFIFSAGLLLWGHPFGNGADNLNAWLTPDAYGLFLLLAMGAVSMAAQVLFTQAMGKTSLALGTLLTLSVPVLAALFGKWFLNESLTPHFGIGLVLVLVACAFLVWQESRPQ